MYACNDLWQKSNAKHFFLVVHLFRKQYVLFAFKYISVNIDK